MAQTLLYSNLYLFSFSLNSSEFHLGGDNNSVSKVNLENEQFPEIKLSIVNMWISCTYFPITKHCRMHWPVRKILLILGCFLPICSASYMFLHIHMLGPPQCCSHNEWLPFKLHNHLTKSIHIFKTAISIIPQHWICWLRLMENAVKTSRRPSCSLLPWTFSYRLCEKSCMGSSMVFCWY